MTGALLFRESKTVPEARSKTVPAAKKEAAKKEAAKKRSRPRAQPAKPDSPPAAAARRAGYETGQPTRRRRPARGL
jgi:hypothetical protein